MLNPLSFDALNPAQREAATHVEGPLLVLAGPGSGKTRVVTHRIAFLISQGVPAHQIVALSFTNKAADEMRRRVSELVGPQPVEMGTFHRFAARLLRRHAQFVGLTSDYSILDPDDVSSLLKRAAKRLGLTLRHTPITRIAGVISRAKNDLLTAESFEPHWGRPVDDVVKKIWPVYQHMLQESNAVDFDDLLVHVATLLVDNPDLRKILDARHRWILVDEYQDTNAVQYSILRGLSIDYQNLAVTGDPDQAIYGWRGASIRNILEFERDYPSAKVVKLEHNYRSTSNILGVADRLIANNSKRKPKQLVTDAEAGVSVRIILDSTSHNEADRIADEIASTIDSGTHQPQDFAILFRTNALSRALEVALRARGVPYQLVRGLEFFKRREIRDIVAWLRLLKNPRDDVAFLRVINVPARGIGKRSLDHLGVWAEQQQVSLLEAVRRKLDIPGVSKRAGKAFKAFAMLYSDLDELARQLGNSVAPLIEAIVNRSGYRKMLELEASAEEEFGEERLANVEELVTAARQLDESFISNGQDDALSTFLETTALVADTDAWDADGQHVALMTLHAAKGLEFPVIYMIAMEDGIIPHERSLDSADHLEEERRLVFVGITRGQKEVHLSCSRIREYRGSRRINAPSLFLTEITGSETDVTGTEAPPDDGTCLNDSRHGDLCIDHDEFTQDVPPIKRNESIQHRSDGLVLDFEEEQLPTSRSKDTHTVSRTSKAASELAKKLEQMTKPTPVFTEGQRVRHDEYGFGTLDSISGSGPRLVATVVFEGDAGIRTFILSHGALHPA